MSTSASKITHSIGRYMPWLLALVFFFLEAGFVYKGLLHDQTPANGDQGAFLELAANLHDGVGFVSYDLRGFKPSPSVAHQETTRQPLYPYVLSFFADRDIGFLGRAKLTTAVMSLSILLLIFACLYRRWGIAASLTAAALIGGHPCFLCFANEIWCENLLTGFFVFSWFFFAVSVDVSTTGIEPKRISWKFIFLSGVLAAFAWLTKRSATVLGASLLVALFWPSPKTTLSWNRRLIFLLMFSLGGLLILGPYFVNALCSGNSISSPDLTGGMFIDTGREAWRVYDTVPTLGTYLAQRGLGTLFEKWLIGLQKVVSVFIQMMREPFPESLGSQFRAIVLAALAITGLLFEKALIRRYLLAFCALNVISFASYAHMDVPYRYLYPILVFVFLYAGLGASAIGSRISGVGKFYWWSFMVVLIGWGAFQAWIPASALEGRQTSRMEVETLNAIHRIIPKDAVFCMGPSHELAYYWVIDRRRIFVPTIDDMEAFRAHCKRFNAKYLYMDRSVILRNPGLFENFFFYDPEIGIMQRKPIPWLETVFQNEGYPLRFILFRIRE